MIFIFAGEVQIYDYDDVIDQLKLSYQEESRYYLNHRKYYHHYIYFIIVSLTTVGYGDITPISILAKFTMVVFVFFILAVIPSQTDELINLYQLLPILSSHNNEKKGGISITKLTKLSIEVRNFQK